MKKISKTHDLHEHVGASSHHPSSASPSRCRWNILWLTLWLVLPLSDRLSDRLSAGSIRCKTIFRRWSKRSQTLSAQFVLVFLVLVANVSLTIYGNLRFPTSGAVGLIYEGLCSEVNSLDAWLHVLISLLSLLMLSASAYCMQLQVTPTRADVDRAHQNGDWVDVGLHTVRNLRFVGRWKRASWVALALTSIPINVL